MSKTTSQSLASTRIATLLDEGSFVEIGGAITARTTDFNMQQKETPADGVITGYGVIDGNLVYVYSQDAPVLKGSIGEMHAKKIANIYDMAMKMGAPVIGLIDCAGLRLQEATDALEAFGEILTGIAMVMLFYIMTALIDCPAIATLPEPSSVKIVLSSGCIVLGLFSILFLLYTIKSFTFRQEVLMK